MNKSSNPFDKNVKFKKIIKDGLILFRYLRAVSSVEKLSSVLIIMRRDNIE